MYLGWPDQWMADKWHRSQWKRRCLRCCHHYATLGSLIVGWRFWTRFHHKMPCSMAHSHLPPIFYHSRGTVYNACVRNVHIIRNYVLCGVGRCIVGFVRLVYYNELSEHDKIQSDPKVVEMHKHVKIHIPAHSNGTWQMFLEDKIYGFKYTYIYNENIVQQTKWYHSSILWQKVHQFIIKNPMCYVKKPFYKTHGLQRRSIQNTINPGIRFTIWTEIKNRQG